MEQPVDDVRTLLVNVLREKALQRLSAPVQLASGAWSSEFVDVKRGLAEWIDLQLAERAVSGEIKARGIHFDAVGGLATGANALAVAIAAVSDSAWFFISKDRSSQQRVLGRPLSESTTVLVVDDVVTSGDSLLEAVAEVRAQGARVVAASTLVDRSDVAGRKLAAAGIPYAPLATYKTLGIPMVVCV